MQDAGSVLIWIVAAVFLLTLHSVCELSAKWPEPEKFRGNWSPALSRYSSIPRDYFENESRLAMLRDRPNDVVYAAYEHDWDQVNLFPVKERSDTFRWQAYGVVLLKKLIREQGVLGPRQLARLIIGD